MLSSCSFGGEGFLQEVKKDFESEGFITHDIFQVVCSVPLHPKESDLLWGDVSQVEYDSTFMKALQKELREKCRQQTLLSLAKNWLVMKKKAIENAHEIVYAFRPFLTGRIVFEEIKEQCFVGVYRVEKKNLIFAINKIKIDNY